MKFLWAVDPELTDIMQDWTLARLQRLFSLYNCRYWRGRLPHYRIVVRRLRPGCLGLCKRKQRVIYIDLAKPQHRSAAEVRRTLLHEMAHAASSGFHGASFYEELLRIAAEHGSQMAVE